MSLEHVAVFLYQVLAGPLSAAAGIVVLFGFVAVVMRAFSGKTDTND